MTELTRERLRELLDYDPFTGEFTWRHRKSGSQSWNARFAGKRAGTEHGDGYRAILIDGKRSLSHRLAWLHVYGEMPTEIDHQDHCRSNNAISNLRDVSRLGNARNHSLQSNNTSGQVGVYWDKSRSLWRAYVYVGKRQRHLGHFERFDDAAACRAAANANLAFHENHGAKVA